MTRQRSNLLTLREVADEEVPANNVRGSLSDLCVEQARGQPRKHRRRFGRQSERGEVSFVGSLRRNAGMSPTVSPEEPPCGPGGKGAGVKQSFTFKPTSEPTDPDTGIPFGAVLASGLVNSAKSANDFIRKVSRHRRAKRGYSSRFHTAKTRRRHQRPNCRPAGT